MTQIAHDSNLWLNLITFAQIIPTGSTDMMCIASNNGSEFGTIMPPFMAITDHGLY